MAKFFFHFFDGEVRCDDELGLELDGPEQAYLEAVAAAHSMLSDLLAERRDVLRCAFEIEDDNGEELFRLEFTELLEGSNGSVRPTHSHEALIAAIEETHRRASSAKAELRTSFQQVYRSLAEATALLARASQLEGQRPPRS